MLQSVNQRTKILAWTNVQVKEVQTSQWGIKAKKELLINSLVLDLIHDGLMAPKLGN